MIILYSLCLKICHSKILRESKFLKFDQKYNKIHKDFLPPSRYSMKIYLMENLMVYIFDIINVITSLYKFGQT
jgi:hypothetical protein